MSELRGACIIGQSGGPTAVINASALGVIRTALDTDCITRVLGAANGIQGVLEDRLYDMGQEDAGELELLRYTPSSALGSCRYKLAEPSQDDTDYRRILEIFRKYDVRYFFYNGGNDSMDTCNKISKYMQSVGYACRVIGVPKTIDNDLNGTDHCPGFGSAARYIATTCMEVQRDTHVYDNGTITVLEIMGRHAGWLAGSAALAAWVGYGPDLIYLPEVDFDMERFLADVHQVYQAKNKCLIAVSEGIHRADGAFIAEGVSAAANDGFGHTQLGGLAALLADLLRQREPSAKVRGIELSSPSAAAPTARPRPTSTRRFWRARRPWRLRSPGIPTRWWPSGAPGREATAARLCWNPWILWPTRKRRFPAPGSTPMGTAWSSPSSTTCSPDSGRPSGPAGTLPPPLCTAEKGAGLSGGVKLAEKSGPVQMHRAAFYLAQSRKFPLKKFSFPSFFAVRRKRTQPSGHTISLQ